MFKSITIISSAGDVRGVPDVADTDGVGGTDGVCDIGDATAESADPAGELLVASVICLVLLVLPSVVVFVLE